MNAITEIMPWSATNATLGADIGADVGAAAGSAMGSDPGDNLFASWLWFDVIARMARPRQQTPAIFSAGGAHLPLWCRQQGNRLIPVAGLTSPYTLIFKPIVTDPSALAEQFLRHVRGVVRFDALEPSDPTSAAFEQAAVAAGLSVHRFEHFSNWFMRVDGDFARWLAGRPGALRNTIKRRVKSADGLQFQHFGFAGSVDAADCAPRPITLDHAVDQFETVYQHSWKSAEPFTGINAAIMRALAEAGLLRVGILADQDRPIAAQYWAMSGGRAYLLKLAYIDTSAARSPGTVLTALMIKALFAAEPLTYLDFGRGDDRYKQDWVSDHRIMQGLLLINPRSVAGCAMLAQLRLGKLGFTRRGLSKLGRTRSPTPMRDRSS